MNTHPYLRAYMAGIAFPTLFLLVILSGYVIVRFSIDVPVAVERAIVFPMALIPNVWGLWNMLYVRQRSRRWVSLGAHGAMLPVVLVPLGIAVAITVLPSIDVPGPLVAGIFLAVWVAYYFVWKFAVGFLNDVLGIG